jgi:alcohol dehydrogenase
MSTGNFTFLCRTKIGFGMNGLEHLPFDLFSMGSQKPLVLLDKDAHLGGCTKPLARAFKESGMTLGICPPLHEDKDADKEIEFLKKFYKIYIDKGFDAIIALGTGKVVDLAKALNIAVTLGPDALNKVALNKVALKTGALKTGTLKTTDMTRITRPLAPFAYIPTGMGTGMETNTIAQFNGNTFSSPFLAPDLVIIDPQILTRDTSDTLINASLTCLSACCEAHVLSGNPPARAYCAAGIELIMENFLPLATLIACQEAPADIESDIKSGNKLSKKTAGRHLARLTHASVITGIILTNCKELLSVPLGKLLATHCSVPPGQAMAILVPTILDLLAKDRAALGNLALTLTGPDEFCTIPGHQRPGVVIQKIQSLLNEIYRISLGTTPRTLADTRLDKQAISGLIQTLFSHEPPGTDIQGIDPKQVQALTQALDGLPHNRDCLKPA